MNCSHETIRENAGVTSVRRFPGDWQTCSESTPDEGEQVSDVRSLKTICPAEDDSDGLTDHILDWTRGLDTVLGCTTGIPNSKWRREKKIIAVDGSNDVIHDL